MAKFKVGDKVVIKDNKNFHRFQIGDVVVITRVDSSGYRGHKVGDDSEAWWAFQDSEIEEYKEEVKVQKFKVGDRVRMIEKGQYSFDRVGMTGTVVSNGWDTLLEIAVDGEHYPISGSGWTYPIENKNWEVIEMPKCKFKVGDFVKGNDTDRYSFTNDKMTKGRVVKVHDCNSVRIRILEHMVSGHIDDEYTVEPEYFDFYEEPKLVQKEKPKTTVLKLDNYKIIFNGDTTVVTDGTRKGVAKRHPDDEYDAVVGLQVALERFHGGRKPKIGDKVRVLKVDGNSRYGRHCYGIGEIVQVVESPYGGVETDIGCKALSLGYRYYTLIAGE